MRSHHSSFSFSISLSAAFLLLHCTGQITSTAASDRTGTQGSTETSSAISGSHVTLPPGALANGGSVITTAAQLKIPYGAIAIAKPLSINVLDTKGAAVDASALLQNLAVTIKPDQILGAEGKRHTAVFVADDSRSDAEQRYFITEVDVDEDSVSFETSVTNGIIALVDTSKVSLSSAFPALPSKDSPAVSVDASTLQAGKQYLNAHDALDLKLKGTCSQDQEAVSISGPTSAVAVCAKGTWNVPVNLAKTTDGEYTFHVNFKDSNGNSAEEATLIVTLDRVAPNFSSLALAHEASDGIISASEKSGTNSLLGTLTAKGYDSVAYRIASAASDCSSLMNYAIAAPRSSDAQFSSDGYYKICVLLKDLAGNTAYGASSTLQVDATLPTVSAGIDVTTGVSTALTGTTSKTGTYLWTKESGPGTITFGNLAALATTASASTAGNYVLRLSVTDSSGNVGTATMNYIWTAGASSGMILPLAGAATDGLINRVEARSGERITGALPAGDYQSVGYVIGAAANSCSDIAVLSYSPRLPVARDFFELASGAYKVCVRMIDSSNAVSFGQSETITRDTVNPTTDPKTVKSVALGFYHSCAILSDNSVRCWGANSNGSLGYDDTANRGGSAGDMAALAAVNLGNGRTAKAVAAGVNTSCAILDNDLVKCWGYGGQGELGNNNNIDIGATAGSMAGLNPINLGVGRTAKSISAAGYGSGGNGSTSICAILDDNSLKCWGRNNQGQLGVDDLVPRGDTAGSMDALTGIDVGAGRSVYAAENGPFHTCAILDNRSIKCWGYNGAGGLGYDDAVGQGSSAGSMAALGIVNLGTGRTAKKLALGNYHTCAILDDDSLKCWGSNYHGELGYEDLSNRGDTGGSMAAIGAVNLGSGRTALAITAGAESTCVILDNGKVKCWGQNNSGQLGYDDAVDRGGTAGSMTSLATVNLGLSRTAKSISLSQSGLRTCAILDDDSLKCWGANASGALGYDDGARRGYSGMAMSDLQTINLGVGRTAKSSTTDGGSNAYSMCVHLDDNSMKCWGNNSYGQLGYDDTSLRGESAGSMAALLPVNVGSGRTIKELTRGRFHTCAILDDSSLKCWGDNSHYALGYDDNSNRGGTANSMSALPSVNLGTGRTAKHVTAGFGHTCAILDNDSLKCWGIGSSGQLGYENSANQGNTAGSMAALGTVFLGSGRTAKAVSAHDSHTCAILDNDTLKCWGLNDRGQLGYDDNVNRGNTASSMTNLLPVNLGGVGVKSVTTGGQGNGIATTCVLLMNDKVKCWGSNALGQLGLDSVTTYGNSAGSMAALPYINLGLGRTAKSIATSESHTCAILDDDSVKCWGTYGLGQDQFQTIGTGPGDMARLSSVNLGIGRTAKSLMLQYRSTCAILDNDTLKCWGDYNSYGVLGYDDEIERGYGFPIAKSLPLYFP